MTKLSFTLGQLAGLNPCLDGVSRLTKSLTGPYDGTTVVNYYDHAEHVTTEDLLWALQLTQLSELDQRTICVRVAIYAARSVIHIFERGYPNDQRPRRAIEAAERCVDENLSVENLVSVRDMIAKLDVATKEARSAWSEVSWSEVPGAEAARAAAEAAEAMRAAMKSTVRAAVDARDVVAWVSWATRSATRAADDPDALRADIKTYSLELIRSYDHD